MDRTSNPPPWLWINLLSLDAPLVALLWQDLLVRSYPSVLYPSGRCVLGLTVWAIYLADRLIDVRHPPAKNETTRHRFYRRHRQAARILLAVVLAADALVAFRWLRPVVFTHGIAVAAAVLAYLAMFSLWRIETRKWKQPCAAALFTIGVFLVAWIGTEHPWHVLAWPAAAFGWLCLGNMLMVEAREEGRPIRAWMTMGILAILCVALGNSRWFSAVALSAAALAALDLRGGKLSADVFGVLADTALCTPVLFR